MNVALITMLSVVSAFAAAFFVSRYSAATPAQRSRLVWAACGAVAVGVGVCLPIALR